MPASARPGVSAVSVALVENESSSRAPRSRARRLLPRRSVQSESEPLLHDAKRCLGGSGILKGVSDWGIADAVWLVTNQKVNFGISSTRIDCASRPRHSGLRCGLWNEVRSYFAHGSACLVRPDRARRRIAGARADYAARFASHGNVSVTDPAPPGRDARPAKPVRGVRRSSYGLPWTGRNNACSRRRDVDRSAQVRCRLFRVASWLARERRKGPADLAIPPALLKSLSEPAAVRLFSCHPSAGGGSRRQGPPGWCQREPTLPARVRWTWNHQRNRRS